MPCSCKVPVHVGCLERWCQERGSPRCEICHTTYSLEGSRQQVIQNALADHAARHRQPPQSALELLISGGDHQGNNEFSRMLQTLRRNARGQDRDSEEEFLRQMQTKRLLLLAAMVLMSIIIVHIMGTFLMSTGPGVGRSTHSTDLHGGMQSHRDIGTLHSTNTTQMNSNSTNSHGHGPYRGNRQNESVMARLFRMMLFFYVIRMLFSRPPQQMHNRGVYL